MLIVEHFFLIAADPRTGTPTWPRALQPAGQLAAAALLLDLATQHCLEQRDRVLYADASLPLSHALLTAALRELAAAPVSVPNALALCERRLHPLPEKVLDALYRRDILHRVARRRWLLWPHVYHPLRSVQARNEAIERLRHAAHTNDDLHGLALLLLADVSGLLPAHLDARGHAAALQRLALLDTTRTQANEALAIFASVLAALLN
jgi:hypothetical protein